MTSDISPGSLSFKVTPILNPPSTQQVSGFIISTSYNDGDMESTSKTTLSVAPTLPNSLTFGDPSLVMSDAKVATLSIYTFYLYTHNPVYPSVNLEITFPNDFDLGISSVTGYLWIVKRPDYQISGKKLTLKNCFEVYVEGNKGYYIDITYIRNPMSVRTSAAIQFRLITDAGYLIDTSNSGIVVTATVGTLRIVTLQGSNTVINAVTSYTFEIVPEQAIMKGAAIRITVPNEMSVLAGGLSNVSGLDADATPTVQIVGDKSFLILQAFPKSFGTTNLRFTYSSLKNPPTTVKSSPFSIEFFEDSSCTYLISSSNSYSITATSDTLVSVSISPASKITGDTAVYTFSMTTKNTIPIGGSILIQLPDQLEIQLNQSPTCSNTQGFEVTFTCQFTSKSVSILNGFMVSSYSPGILNVSISSFKNPPTTASTQSFSVSSYTGDYPIDKLSTGLVVTMDTPHKLLSASFESEVDVITGATQDYILRITPYNYMPSGGFVSVTPPIWYSYLSTVYCEPSGAVTYRATCSLISTALRITVTFQQVSVTSTFEVKLKNIKNPSSTQESDSFTVVTRDGDYLIDSISEGLTLFATIPATLQSVSITSEKPEISSLGYYEFKFTTINIIPSGGNLEIIFPAQISYSYGYLCYRGTARVSCIFNSSNTLRVLGFSSETRPTTLTIKVTNIRNSSTAGRSDVFKITTKTPTYLIDSSTDQSVTFTCRDPCASCNLTPDTCTSCNLGSTRPYFWGGVCNSSCELGTYDDGTLACKSCSSPCMSCIYSSTYCTSCDSSSEYPYLYNTQCITKCPDNYLISEDNTCFICSENCKTCSSSPNDCTSCVSPLYLYKNTCISSCSSYNQIIINSQCYDCDYNCKSCKNSPTYCSSCADGMKLYENRCVSSCPVEVSIDMGSYCSSCTSNCSTCNSSTSTCMSCISGYVYLEGKCMTICPDRYTLIQGICVKCASTCEVCTGSSDNCTKCIAGKYLYSGKCLNSCPQYISIALNYECLPCLSDCTICSGRTDYCIECIDGKYLHGSSCLSSCPLDSIPVDGVCKECTANCSICDQTTQKCLKCEGSLVLYNDQCIKECADGLIIVDGTCKECADKCISCELVPEYCKTCKEEYLLFVGQCLEECPEGYQDVEGECMMVGNECAEGCSEDKRSNDKCDEECNNEECELDYGKCSPPDDDDVPNNNATHVEKVYNTTYTDSLNAEEDPLPISSVGIVVGSGVFAAKLFLGGFTFLPSVISVWSVLESISWWATLGVLASTDSTHGRELLSEDTEIKIAISFMCILMIIHYLINLSFILCYIFYILKRDSLHRIWYNKHYRFTHTLLVFSGLISFKLFRLMHSELFQSKRCSAKFDKWTNLYRPMIYFTLVDIAINAVPMVILTGCCLWVYSTGNNVWLMALDALIITALVVVVSLVDVYYMRKVIAREDTRQKFVSKAISKAGLGDDTVLDDKMKGYIMKDLHTDRSVGDIKMHFNQLSEFAKNETNTAGYYEDPINTVSDLEMNTLTRQETAKFKETPSSAMSSLDREKPLDQSFDIFKYSKSDSISRQDSVAIIMQDSSVIETHDIKLEVIDLPLNSFTGLNLSANSLKVEESNREVVKKTKK